MEPADMRIDYTIGSLDEDSAAADPLDQFERWFREAASSGLAEPSAMTLATVSAAGRPSTRIVLMKGYSTDGIVFFTNYDSRKGRELTSNRFAAAQFHWVPLQRVVRIEGAVSRIADAESDAYFDSRPLASRLAAWASPQSAVIADRQVLQAGFDEAAARFGEHPPRPPHWGGFRLEPERWEFWQGRPSRLHDRLSYRLSAGHWVRERLAP